MRMLERLKSGDDLAPKRAPRYDALQLGVGWPRQELCARIKDERLARRMEAGMPEEVRSLAQARRRSFC